MTKMCGECINFYEHFDARGKGHDGLENVYGWRECSAQTPSNSLVPKAALDRVANRTGVPQRQDFHFEVCADNTCTAPDEFEERESKL